MRASTRKIWKFLQFWCQAYENYLCPDFCTF